MAAVMVYAERKVAAFMQQRYGPCLVGPQGPAAADRRHRQAVLQGRAAAEGGRRAAVLAGADHLGGRRAIIAFAPVPFGAPTTFFGLLDEPIALQVADVNVAVLVVFAVASMGVYGIVLAGWASNSQVLAARRPAQLGADDQLRAGLRHGAGHGRACWPARCRCARSSTRSRATGSALIPRWNVFVDVPVRARSPSCCSASPASPRPTARRSTFPEAEQELVAGYHTEYSSMRFAMFFMAEYINMVTVSAVAANLFLGGWHGPFLPPEYGWIWFLIKLGVPAVRLPVAALDAAAVPLRPADVVRLEGAAAAGHRQPARHGRGGALLWPLMPLLFYVFAAVTVVGALLVVVAEEPGLQRAVADRARSSACPASTCCSRRRSSRWCRSSSTPAPSWCCSCSP